MINAVHKVAFALWRSLASTVRYYIKRQAALAMQSARHDTHLASNLHKTYLLCSSSAERPFKGQIRSQVRFVLKSKHFGVPFLQ
jgi:hypothetical protein